MDEGKVLLIDEIAKLSDLDLVKLSLAALAVLHQRAVAPEDTEEDQDG